MHHTGFYPIISLAIIIVSASAIAIVIVRKQGERGKTKVSVQLTRLGMLMHSIILYS
jgi:hypothetical protein